MLSGARIDGDIAGKSGPSTFDAETGETDKEQQQQQQQHQQAMDGLQRTMRAAWWRNLRPLEDGLIRLNGALYNGVIQLYGAHKVNVQPKMTDRKAIKSTECYYYYYYYYYYYDLLL